MSESIKQTYREIEVVYVEDSNAWNFTVNGRERNVESLSKAKESIDRALDYERKEKPWKPFAAFHRKYSGEKFQLVTVTSQAEGRSYSGGSYFWITNSEKKRSKESSELLYAVTDANKAAIARHQELDKQLNALSQEQRELVESLEKIQVPQ